MANFNQNRTWGVEIEFKNTNDVDIKKVVREINEAGVKCYEEGYNHRDQTGYWKKVTDSSVDSDNGQFGHELVSPPLKGDEGFRQLKIVCEVLKANHVKINKSCGLHVHHDANDFTAENFKRLFAMYVTYEGAIDAMMPESRRGQNNKYCSSTRTNRYNSEADVYQTQQRLNDIKACKTTQELSRIYQEDRYFKLNLQSFTRHGTIEFRQHSGTIEYDKIESWIVLTNMMVERSMSQVTYKYNPDRDTFYDFSRRICLYEQAGADGLAVKVRKFYQQRTIEHSGREALGPKVRTVQAIA